MPDYQKMYYLLFNAITDALTELESTGPDAAVQRLKTAQADCEELYISAADK